MAFVIQRRTVITVVILLAAIGAFAATRMVLSQEGATAQADPTTTNAPPLLDSTPVPGATPDLSRPGWYIPYVSEDGAKPRLQGIVNGISIGLKADSAKDFGRCDQPRRITAAERDEQHAGSSVTASTLPHGMSYSREPEYLVCDGEVTWMDAVVSVPPRTNELGGGFIRVNRWVGKPFATVSGPADRWFPTTAAGLPGAAMRPIIESVGDSALIVYDKETSVVTELTGEGVYLSSLEELMEELLK